MLSIKIWERYFLKEFLKTFSLFLGCFYALYILIDFSSNAASYLHHHVQFQWEVTVLYYFWEFIKRVDVLLPFALLIATVRTLCNLNIHNELVALLSGGVGLKTLLRPFVAVGLFCTVLMYLNNQFLLPTALRDLKHIDTNRSREKHKNQNRAAAQHVALSDSTTLIFHNYDSANDYFFDAYWIRSLDDIYRIKYLYPNTTTTGIPSGRFVEHLQRKASGELVRLDSAFEKDFANMLFNKETLFETITPPNEQSITALWEKLPQHKEELSEKESQTVTAFLYKLVMPWFCLLAILGPAPSCLRCTRQLPIFFIFACSIFSLVAFYLIVDASVVLGERNVITPFAAVGIPFALFSTVITTRFFQKC